MLHEYVSKWIELEREKGNDRLDVSTVGILYDFAYWLESAAELLRVPAEPEQPCPRCEGAGQCADYIGKRVCSLCGGTGRANRSGRG